MKTDPYYQWQKCSRGLPICSKIKFMRISAGVRWRGAVKQQYLKLKTAKKYKPKCATHFRSLHQTNKIYKNNKSY